MNLKSIFLIVIVMVAMTTIALCVDERSQAEMQALGFLEQTTGMEFVADDLDVVKTVEGPHEATGLIEGESRWRVEGTVAHRATRDKYSVRIFVDEIDGGDRWRLQMIHMAPGVGVPVGQMEQIYP